MHKSKAYVVIHLNGSLCTQKQMLDLGDITCSKLWTNTYVHRGM